MSDPYPPSSGGSDPGSEVERASVPLYGTPDPAPPAVYGVPDLTSPSSPDAAPAAPAYGTPPPAGGYAPPSPGGYAPPPPYVPDAPVPGGYAPPPPAPVGPSAAPGGYPVAPGGYPGAPGGYPVQPVVHQSYGYGVVPGAYPVVVPKSPVLSLLLSFFFPGVGSIVNGDVGKGVGILIGWLACCFTFWLFLPVLGVLALWIWGMVDAYTGAVRWNQRHGVIG